MRAVVQRVCRARVWADGQVRAQIEAGLLVYLAVGRDDDDEDLAYLVEKVRHLRIFTDAAGKMNLEVGQVGGQVMVVSAFSVYGDARRGRRPSFDAAAGPQHASRLYERFCKRLASTGLTVQQGVFAAHMDVEAVNDGPICILLDSRRGF
ncbi:MAG: D-aminoacyl-tRNA deacylase [Phycisphaerae bacterium]